ncbi:hypothetical protein VR46_03260 [Streptomyces sp. NRRL S-444]|nr:hypothetical protein VR46_03260 [Streptomyces sp. NRRL S-444]
MTFSHQRSAAGVRVGGLRVSFAGVAGGVVPGFGAGVPAPGAAGVATGGGWGGSAVPGGVVPGGVVPGGVVVAPLRAESAGPCGPGVLADVLVVEDGDPASCWNSTGVRGATLSPARRSGPGATAPAAA